MRKLYSDFKRIIMRRKDHFDRSSKFPDPNAMWVLPCFLNDQDREEYTAESRKSVRYTQFSNKYVDKIWLDESNWKTAYDAWEVLEKDYNKFDVITFHRLIKAVIPYLNREFSISGKVRCDDFLYYGIEGGGFTRIKTYHNDSRAIEFAMAAVYDTQTIRAN